MFGELKEFFEKISSFKNKKQLELLEGKQQINYEIFDNLLSFLSKKEKITIRKYFLDEENEQKKELDIKNETNFQEIIENIKNENTNELINLDGYIPFDIENLDNGNNEQTQNLNKQLKNKQKELKQFKNKFNSLFQKLQKINFLFEDKNNILKKENIEKNPKNIFQILDLITPENNPEIVKNSKKISILLFLINQEKINLSNDEQKSLLFTFLNFNFNLEENIIEKIIENIFGIEQNLIGNKANKFINSQIIKKLYEIKNFEERKKITKIIFLKDRLFMGEDTIQNKNLFNFLKENENKLNEIYNFLEKNNIKNISEDELIEIFEKDTFKIPEKKEKIYTPSFVKINPTIKTTSPKSKKTKTKPNKLNPNKTTEQQKKIEKIKLNHKLDGYLEKILTENNLNEINDFGEKTEKFINNILKDFKAYKLSSTNDNRGAGGGKYTKSLHTILDKLKKQKYESYSDFLNRIKIIDYSNYFGDAEIKDTILKKIVNEAFSNLGKKGFFESLENFSNNIISKIKLNEKEDINLVIDKYNSIIEKEFKKIGY